MFGNGSKLAEERHQRLITTMNEQHRSLLESLKGLRLDVKQLRETQIAAKKNGNGQAVAAKAKQAAPPLGYGAAGAALGEIVRYFTG